MSSARRKVIPLVVSLSVLGGTALAQEPAFPVKVSENKRYFVDQKGQPVFWLGTTQWELFRRYTLDEARMILERSRANGFVFVQVKLLGQGDGSAPNLAGEKPWVNDNVLTPSEPYFRNVDAVVKMANDNHMIISMTIYHQQYRQRITVDKAKAWARWLALRYKDAPNIVWSTTPEAKDEFVPILRELAAGLHDGDGGRHLITFKPDPAPFSSSFIHGEPWLDFDSMQVWASLNLIYPMVTKDYQLKPTKPVLMAEGAYEAGEEYGFAVTPLWIRRQAYYSYLAGAHHTYGHNDSWRVRPTWKKALDAPGAVQLGIMKKIFMGRKEWWLLVPDQSILTAGGQTDGKVLNLAARHEAGLWIMVYMADKGTVTVDMAKLKVAKAKAVWIDPRTGDGLVAGEHQSSGTKSFSTPDGWEDALLVIEAADGAAQGARS